MPAPLSSLDVERSNDESPGFLVLFERLIRRLGRNVEGKSSLKYYLSRYFEAERLSRCPVDVPPVIAELRLALISEGEKVRAAAIDSLASCVQTDYVRFLYCLNRTRKSPPALSSFVSVSYAADNIRFIDL